MDRYHKTRIKILQQYGESLKNNPPRPKQCKFCGANMKIVFDDFDSVESKKFTGYGYFRMLFKENLIKKTICFIKEMNECC